MAFKHNIIRAFENGRTEGKVEGEAEGEAEAILELLEDMGPIPEKLREKVFLQMDLELLKKWHKLAARVRTIEEFERRIEEQEASNVIGD